MQNAERCCVDKVWLLAEQTRLIAQQFLCRLPDFNAYGADTSHLVAPGALMPGIRRYFICVKEKIRGDNGSSRGSRYVGTLRFAHLSSCGL